MSNQFIILRHAKYDKNICGLLTCEGAEASLKKGKEIKDLIGNISKDIIRIYSSTALRALETAEMIEIGIDYGNLHIVGLKDLREDSEFSGNIQIAIEFIKYLIQNGFVIIIIAHFDNIYPIARAFGYTGQEKTHPDNLDGYNFIA